MCVAIVMAPGTKLTVDEVVKMGKANGDGVGFAWADGTAVHWLKAVGYDPEKVSALINRHEDEFRLVHFRLATAGGIKAELCHPFEIGPRAGCSAAGSGAKVLIHNGHWRRWTDIFDLMKKEEILPDHGPWSDTRFAALCASWDMDWLDTVDGKVAVMDADGNIKTWGSWDKLRDGLLVSNTYWQTHTGSYTRSGRDRNWIGWGWTEENWRDWEAAKKAEAEREAAKKELGDGEVQKEGAGSEGKKEEGKSGETTTRVDNGSGDGPLFPARGSAVGDDGVHSGNRNGKGQHVSVAKGSQLEGQKKDGKEGQESLIFDHTPWQNPSTKKWFRVPFDCEQTGRSRIEEITAKHARSLLVQAAVTDGTSGGEQGTGDGDTAGK